MLHYIKRVQAEQFIPEDEFEPNSDTIPHTYHPDAGAGRVWAQVAGFGLRSPCPARPFFREVAGSGQHPDAAWHCPNCGWNAQIVQSPGGKAGGRWYRCRHCGWGNHTSMPGLGSARLYLMPADDGDVCAADDDYRQKIPIQLRGCGTEEERAFARRMAGQQQQGGDA